MAHHLQAESPNARFLAECPRARLTTNGAIRSGVTFSLVLHAAAFGIILVVLSRATATVSSPSATARVPDGIIWIADARPGGGGGGGGSRTPEPPRASQAKGADRLTLPVSPQSSPARKIEPEPSEPVPAPIIPAVPMASGTEQLTGLVASVSLPLSASRGPGSGDGAGTGGGSGSGPGGGSGLEAGTGGGTGGDEYEPGGSVSSPRLIHETRPNYTPEAMRAKVQGMVLLEAVVLPDGSIGAVQVRRSLDPRFGLDQEAMRTVREWRFAPALRNGGPVPVRIAIELTFTLR